MLKLRYFNENSLAIVFRALMDIDFLAFGDAVPFCQKTLYPCVFT